MFGAPGHADHTVRRQEEQAEGGPSVVRNVKVRRLLPQRSPAMQKVPEHPSWSGKSCSARAQCSQLRLGATTAGPGTLGCAGLDGCGQELGAPLTRGLLAVDDTEATVHAGCQEQVAVQGVPPEPPHPALHGHVCERLLHVPRVPQQNVLVIAETQQQGPSAGTSPRSPPHAPGPGTKPPPTPAPGPHGPMAGRTQELPQPHLPVARMPSWWGLLWMLHTPMRCL